MPDIHNRRYEAPPTSAARVPMRSRCWEPPDTASRSKRTSAARRRLSEAMQPGLFLELEVTTTRDEPFADGVEQEIKRLIEPVAWQRCEIVNKAEQTSLKTVLEQWRRK